MTPEGKVKKDIHAFLQSLEADCWYYCPIPMGYGRKGIPDFIGCYRGHFFSIEAKAPGKIGEVTPWQIREATAIKYAKGSTFLVDGATYLPQAFEHIKNKYAL